MSSEAPLYIELNWNGERWIADVRHTATLTEEEKKLRRIQQESFLVHLCHPSGFRSFEMFIGDNYTLETTAALTIEYELLQRLECG